MAKGNALMGQMRGKVGDLVFTRLAGEQVTKTRNAHPKNPQTTKQMAQRLQLETAVAFFKQGREAFFKFAFEGKAPGNSDYNAFVKANVGRVPCNTKAALKIGLPSAGEYIMTSGTLPSLRYLVSERDEAFIFETAEISVTFENLTIGQLSSNLINHYGLENGDFITVVGITSSASTKNSLAEMIQANALVGDVTKPSSTKWTLKQFRLDNSSSVKVSTLGIFTKLSNDSYGLVIDQDLAGGTHSSTYAALCITVSRDVVGGVKVSTQQLALQKSTKQTVDLAMSKEWFEFCGNTFNDGGVEVENKDRAILEGSLAVNP